MSADTGLPDYVGDHFSYLVKSSKVQRLGQAVFFGSSLLLPVVMGAVLLTWTGALPRVSRLALLTISTVFSVSVLWYLVWMQNRLRTFRSERPASYERWYGFSRRRSFGGSSLPSQFKLAKMQLRYVFLGREPSPEETLQLTMQFSRRS